MVIPYDPSDVFLDLFARRHDLSAAGLAADLEIHADAQQRKNIAAAGMRFFHLQTVAGVQLHEKTPPR
jgi:hypothetical protein